MMMRRRHHNILLSLSLLVAGLFSVSLQSSPVSAWVTTTTKTTPPSVAAATGRRRMLATTTRLSMQTRSDDAPHDNNKKNPILHQLELAGKTSLFALALMFGSTQLHPPQAAQAADAAQVGLCLLKKCQLPLAKCILNPNCMANVICINSCNGKPDETECQIECGNLFENDVVGEFNKCAVSDMTCVPKKADDGSYPVPNDDMVVPKFDTKLFEGQWYITAGQNKLFDIFPCQVHFFTNTGPGKFFGKLNWRIEEPDGEFFSRDALQRFVQDPKQPAHLINHDNEYLHYEDDWWIIDYEYDNNDKGVPPFAFVYYRGNNDAWEGYGGVVVYTRASKLPESLLPRLREAAEKVGFDFDKDFTATDNTCQPTMSEGEALLLREKFAGKVALQTEKQLQAQATKLRGNVVNGVKAQVLFVNQELEEASKAFQKLSEQANDFEKANVESFQKSNNSK